MYPTGMQNARSYIEAVITFQTCLIETLRKLNDLTLRPQSSALAALAARFEDWRYAHPADGRLDPTALVRALRAHRPCPSASRTSGEPR